MRKYSRRKFIGTSSAAMLAGMASPAIGASAQSEKSGSPDVDNNAHTDVRSRPNLILFMPDEMRADALACYGNPMTRTPNLDLLARGGARFANCHVQFPVCGASRCSLLTGWPTSVRGHRSLFYFLRPDEPNMFRYLRQAGYDVYWYGKNDALAAASFSSSVTEWNYSDHLSVGAVGGAGSVNARGSVVEAGGENLPRTFINNRSGDRRATNDYKFVNAAIRILERKETDRPFCIFLPLSSPHPPYGAPEGFHNMYHPADVQGLRPINLAGKPNYMAVLRKAYGLDMVSEDTFRKVRALYYGMVSYSDWLLGELLEAVERTHHTNDTAIFVLSDHGDYAGDYGLVEKWPSGLEDVLTHVPLIARIPGGRRNVNSKELVELFDVMATCVELAGTRTNHTHFARSLLPQMQGSAGDPNRAAFAEGGYNTYEPQCFEANNHDHSSLYFEKGRLQCEHPETITRAAMVRTRDYKLVSRPQGQSELYLYRDDPTELHNRFGEAGVAGIQVAMQQKLLHWYVNTTGIAPFDKDQRTLPPYYETPSFPVDHYA